jgi:hypothetical protein
MSIRIATLFLTNSIKNAKNMTSGTKDMVEDMAAQEKRSKFDSITRSLANKGFSFLVRAVDKYAPDRLLLFALNFLDRRVPNRLISFAIRATKRLAPSRLRSTAIAAADEYVPDDVANSRKVCAVIAGVGKYIPDEMIPPESAGRWENLRTKFHIPKLVSSSRK